MKDLNIVIAGVGGQGTLLASRILARVIMDHDLDVKVSEVHGMAQRGGSVVSFVRGGEKVYSPLIHPGQADYLISFERLEALRWAHMLKKNGILISADAQIMPSGQNVLYPADIDEQISNYAVRVFWLPAGDIAQKAGNQKAVNTVLLGALATMMDFEEDSWLNALKNEVPSKLQEINLKAFMAGAEAIRTK